MLKYELHEAKYKNINEGGFNFPYLLVYPNEMPKDTKILVECVNTANYYKADGSCLTFEQQIVDAKDYAQTLINNVTGMQEGYNFIGQLLLIPLTERCDDKGKEYYTQQLGRNVVCDKTGKFAKLSTQVVNMVEDAKELIKSQNENVAIAEKSAIVGFSSSGVFAGRLAFLEPEHFDFCLSICSNAVQPLPLDKYNGISLPYPLGTADYEEITGKKFNKKEYDKIKQLFCVGEDEPNDKYNIVHEKLLFDEDVKEKYIKAYGDVSLQERQDEMHEIFESIGAENVTCCVSPDGHTLKGKEKVIIGFVKKNLGKYCIGKTNNIERKR